MKTKKLKAQGYENVVRFEDDKTGLKAIIAVHDTTLGPALGGCRMWPYASEEEALEDVLRLSKGMTFKNALAGLALGGGKAVIIGDPKRDKSPALFEAFGRCIESLEGAYYTAEDVGMRVEDVEQIARQTRYAVGLKSRRGSGDPSPYTAYGVFLGLCAAIKIRLKSDSLDGINVIVTGLGHVGYELCRLLHKAGAHLIVADIDRDKVRKAQDEFSAHEAHPTEAFAKKADVFAPCALGGAISSVSAPLLQVAVVAGSANNQLVQPECGDRLHDMGILYAPDYVINSGGVISVGREATESWGRGEVLVRIEGIPETLTSIFERSALSNQPPQRIADNMALEILQMAQLKKKKLKVLENVA